MSQSFRYQRKIILNVACGWRSTFRWNNLNVNIVVSGNKGLLLLSLIDHFSTGNNEIDERLNDVPMLNFIALRLRSSEFITFFLYINITFFWKLAHTLEPMRLPTEYNHHIRAWNSYTCVYFCSLSIHSMNITYALCIFSE